MTRAEYDKLAGWFLAGTAEVNSSVTGWEKLHWLPTFENARYWSVSDYRECPKPTMPDEVWVAPATQECQMGVYLEPCGAGQIRYIRADGIIPGEWLEYRGERTGHDWVTAYGLEYRFKP